MKSLSLDARDIESEEIGDQVYVVLAVGAFCDSFVHHEVPVEVLVQLQNGSFVGHWVAIVGGGPDCH
jgi:hypothetical protein